MGKDKEKKDKERDRDRDEKRSKKDKKEKEKKSHSKKEESDSEPERLPSPQAAPVAAAPGTAVPGTPVPKAVIGSPVPAAKTEMEAVRDGLKPVTDSPGTRKRLGTHSTTDRLASPTKMLAAEMERAATIADSNMESAEGEWVHVEGKAPQGTGSAASGSQAPASAQATCPDMHKAAAESGDLQAEKIRRMERRAARAKEKATEVSDDDSSSSESHTPRPHELMDAITSVNRKADTALYATGREGGRFLSNAIEVQTVAGSKATGKELFEAMQPITQYLTTDGGWRDHITQIAQDGNMVTISLKTSERKQECIRVLQQRLDRDRFRVSYATTALATVFGVPPKRLRGIILTWARQHNITLSNDLHVCSPTSTNASFALCYDGVLLAQGVVKDGLMEVIVRRKMTLDGHVLKAEDISQEVKERLGSIVGYPYTIRPMHDVDIERIVCCPKCRKGGASFSKGSGRGKGGGKGGRKGGKH
mmetsp:Transcript_36368/g.77431  ORF Transcript_36368/g.77431 Transcript_36368/m.77431 type:complete len:477 (-) Transcript_36368:44-1474(-)